MLKNAIEVFPFFADKHRLCFPSIFAKHRNNMEDKFNRRKRTLQPMLARKANELTYRYFIHTVFDV